MGKSGGVGGGRRRVRRCRRFVCVSPSLFPSVRLCSEGSGGRRALEFSSQSCGRRSRRWLEIVPHCAREFVNDVTGNMTTIEAIDGHTYDIKVHKGKTKTRIYGEQCFTFLQEYDMEVGDKILFKMDCSEENVEVVQMYAFGGIKDCIDPLVEALDSVICIDSVVLNHNQYDKLCDIVLIPKCDMGPPFVHRLTRTNIELHSMPKKLKPLGKDWQHSQYGERHYTKAEYDTAVDGRIYFTDG